MKGRNWRKITPLKLWNYVVVDNAKYALWHFCAYFPFFQDIMFHTIRPMLWRWIGVHVGKNVLIGSGVYLDVGCAKHIFIEDNAMIASQSLLLAHKRDIAQYMKVELQNELPSVIKEIHIKENVSIGMRTMIMPGVTIGEGAIIGAGSMVSKDIPPLVIAVGNPIRIIKDFNA